MSYVILSSFILLILEALYSGSEIAILASDRARLMIEREKGIKSAKLVLSLLDEPHKLLSSTLTGTNISIVLNTTIVTSFFIKKFGHGGEFYAIVTISPLIWIFGEILPKTIFQTKATYYSKKMAYFVKFSYFLFYPLIFVFERISNTILSLFKLSHVPTLTKSELIIFLRREKGFGQTEREILKKTEKISRKRACEVMIPLIDVKAMDENALISDTLSLMEKEGLSRVPIYRERVDNIVGFVHIFDLLKEDLSKKVKYITKPILYVPYSKPIDEVLEEFQKRKVHIGVVVDEYGGAEGIITIEDILEEVVGEIEDEFDKRKFTYKKIRENYYLIGAKLEVEKFCEVFGVQLPEGDYETIGGFLLENFGYVPEVGEEFRYKNLKFKVTKASKKSIEEVSLEIGEDGDTKGCSS